MCVRKIVLVNLTQSLQDDENKLRKKTKQTRSNKNRIKKIQEKKKRNGIMNSEVNAKNPDTDLNRNIQ